MLTASTANTRKNISTARKTGGKAILYDGFDRLCDFDQKINMKYLDGYRRDGLMDAHVRVIIYDGQGKNEESDVRSYLPWIIRTIGTNCVPWSIDWSIDWLIEIIMLAFWLGLLIGQ